MLWILYKVNQYTYIKYRTLALHLSCNSETLDPMPRQEEGCMVSVKGFQLTKPDAELSETITRPIKCLDKGGIRRFQWGLQSHELTRRGQVQPKRELVLYRTGMVWYIESAL
jgi:hypothetical protein